MLWESEIYEK